jgi:alpha-N-arabinofuranosidase
MHRRIPILVSIALAACAAVAAAAADPEPFAARQVSLGTDPGRATVRVRVGRRSLHTIPRGITGKFAEHLGWNIYNGMDAQILRNPTFAEYPFSTSQMSPDGVARFHSAEGRITEELRRSAPRFGWPDAELDALTEARTDGLAAFWTRVGPRDAVRVSPDTGPHGGRAQRVETAGTDQGIAQWTWLPLHRARRFEFELLVRSPDLNALRVVLRDARRTPSGDLHAQSVACETNVGGMTRQWGTLRGAIELPESAPTTSAYQFEVTATRSGQFVIRHAFLRPADHVAGADPDIVRLLRESQLPVLRWPGGNFVSGYHWRDGVGPVAERPTRPNYAWGGVEPNTFGTDEFMAFCRAVGCEPMICLNAGDGTAAEAAAWVEYCNGPATSPLGRLRAARGHPEPYGIRHWEIGNELWGRWQYHWTTAAGYVDRLHEFVPALLAADPTLRLYVCGAPVFWGKAWNDTLIAGAAPLLQTITDHPLIGGDVPAQTDPIDVYRDFLAVPEALERKWNALRADLDRAGVRDPRLAVTELQLFAHVTARTDTNAPVRLTPQTLPSQGSITEAIYDVLVYHAAIRLAPFVDLITHSAVVNHGGGLRKERERVFAQPCHHAQAAFAAFAGATPVALEIEAGQADAPRVLPDLRRAVPEVRYSLVDALAAVAPDGRLLLSLVQRASAGPIRVTVRIDPPTPDGVGLVWQLAGAQPASGNSLDSPAAVSPSQATVAVRDGAFEIDLPPFSIARVILPSVQPRR